MVEILQNKSSSTRFQILVEIAASGPDIQQRNIAARLGITPQAVSDYVRQLTDESMIYSSGRSSYRITPVGVNWMLKTLRELREYIDLAAGAITNITVCAAIAESDLKQGQTVGLRMKDGLLYATGTPGKGAKGVAVSTVLAGEDVDVSRIEGLVELTRARITVLRVPAIQEGGSRQTNIRHLGEMAAGGTQIGAIGIEALVALRHAGIEPGYRYGVTGAAIEAARCGLPFIIVCTGDAVPGLTKTLQDESLDYDLVDLALKKQ